MICSIRMLDIPMRRMRAFGMSIWYPYITVFCRPSISSPCFNIRAKTAEYLRQRLRNFPMLRQVLLHKAQRQLPHTDRCALFHRTRDLDKKNIYKPVRKYYKKAYNYSDSLLTTKVDFMSKRIFRQPYRRNWLWRRQH